MARGGEDFASWQDWENCHKQVETDHWIVYGSDYEVKWADEAHICYTYQTNYKRLSVKINTLKSQDKGGILAGISNKVYETTQTNSWMRKFAEHTYETTFYGSESSYSRRTSKHLKERLQKFCKIDNEYELGLTANEIFSPAFEYAKAKAASERTFWEFAQTTEGLVGIVLVIAAIIVNFAPGIGQGASAAIGKVAAGYLGLSAAATTAAAVITQIAVAAATLSAYFGGQYYSYTAAKAQGEAASASRYHSASAALKAKQEAEEAKAQLTALMIYGGYEIYANGSIYKKGAAGSQTFNSQIAFDANKGILGQIKQDEFGEQLQGRYGGKLGGGEYFHQNLMQVDFPLQKFSYGIEQKMDMLEKRLKRNVVRVVNGFNKLFENYFNADENGAATYERVYTLHTKPIKTSMKSEAFLDTLKCYSRDEMQTYNYINQATFRERKENTDPIYIYFNSTTYKAYMDDETIGGYLKRGYSEDEARKLLFEKKIITYLQNLRLVFESIEDYAESEFIKGNLVFVYQCDFYTTPDPAGDVFVHYTTKSEPFNLNTAQGTLYGINYNRDLQDDSEQVTRATSQSVSFLNVNYFSFGYNGSVDTNLQLTDFDLFGGYFKEDFDRENLTGDKMIENYKECLSRLIKMKVSTYNSADNTTGEITKYFFLIREAKSYTYIENRVEKTDTAEFFAIEIPQAAFECYSVPLYIPEKLKADFEKYDFSSVKGFL